MLEHEATPVTATGMLRLRDLIASGTGPLWGVSEQALDEAIERTFRELAPDTAVHPPESRVA